VREGAVPLKKGGGRLRKRKKLSKPTRRKKGGERPKRAKKPLEKKPAKGTRPKGSPPKKAAGITEVEME
jgi:hypothetical protein